MLKKILILSAAIGIYTGTLNAATTISTTTHDGRIVTVTAITPEILRVTNAAAGEQSLPSRAVVLPEAPGITATASLAGPMKILSTADGITATIDTRTGVLTIAAGASKVITDNGIRHTANGRTTIALGTTSTGSFYGAGERGHSLDLRGDTLVMYNRQNYGYTGSDPRISQMNITMPLVLSSDGFALLFDDYDRSEMILGNPIEYTTDNDHPVTYYFINGTSTLADVTEQLTALTGRQPLAPFWSLGYITSKYGYRTQDETLGTVDTLQRAGYPLDGIVLDLYWYGVEQDMGRLSWDPEQWPDPKGMLAELRRKNVNLIAISQPYILRNGRALDNYNSLDSAKMMLLDSAGNTKEVKIWVGEGGMFDVSNPDTRTWLANRYKELTETGIGGWWGDLGEPEVHPSGAVHHNGLSTEAYHNQYGNDWSEIIYDMWRTEYPGRRLMTLMRGGTIGLQRYCVFPWSTDVSRSWGGLEPQVRIMLNSGLSGLGYMSHDVGGFAVDPESAYMPELYVRWLQLGLFSPILRTHAQQFAEPYNYPQYASIIEPVIRERYRWLPYNYTLAWENAAKGYPLVRPLNFTEPSTRAYDHISDEFLWGSQVLVAPVMTEGTSQRQVTFPAGKWVAIDNPATVYEGGTTATIDAPLDKIPVFARAGAFIPKTDYKMTSTADYDPGRLTINYYPVEGQNSEFTLYDDDRTSADNLTTGRFRLINFAGSNDGRRISIDATGTYPGAPANIDITLVIHRVDANTTYRINGRKVKSRCNEVDGTLTLYVRWPVNRAMTIEATELKLK